MVPPLPAPSRPSKTMQTFRPLYLTHSWSLTSSTWSRSSSCSYSLPLSFFVEASSRSRAIVRLLTRGRVSKRARTKLEYVPESIDVHRAAVPESGAQTPVVGQHVESLQRSLVDVDAKLDPSLQDKRPVAGHHSGGIARMQILGAGREIRVEPAGRRRCVERGPAEIPQVGTPDIHALQDVTA